MQAALKVMDIILKIKYCSPDVTDPYKYSFRYLSVSVSRTHWNRNQMPVEVSSNSEGGAPSLSCLASLVPFPLEGLFDGSLCGRVRKVSASPFGFCQFHCCLLKCFLLVLLHCR